MNHNFAKPYCYWHFETEFLKNFVSPRALITTKRNFYNNRFFANSTFDYFSWDIRFSFAEVGA